MKSEELRIGNFVLDIELNKVVEITMLGKKGISCSVLDDDSEKEDYIYSSKIEPIPLNEEWLLRFGFKRVEETCDDYTEVTYHLKTEQAYFVIEDDMSLAIADTEIGYEMGVHYLTPNKELTNKVHLLQSVFYFITGQELNIQ